jgi:hypothetical protein
MPSISFQNFIITLWSRRSLLYWGLPVLVLSYCRTLIEKRKGDRFIFLRKNKSVPFVCLRCGGRHNAETRSDRAVVDTLKKRGLIPVDGRPLVQSPFSLGEFLWRVQVVKLIAKRLGTERAVVIVNCFLQYENFGLKIVWPLHGASSLTSSLDSSRR